MTVNNQIILVLEEHGGEFSGTEELAKELNALRNKTFILRVARKLESAGDIIILPSKGGRGCKTVYKRNLNQPGLPTRRRKP